MFSVPRHFSRVFQIFSHDFLSNTVCYRFYRDLRQAILNFHSFELHRFSFIKGGDRNYLFTHLVLVLLLSPNIFQDNFANILLAPVKDSVTVTGPSLEVDSIHRA